MCKKKHFWPGHGLIQFHLVGLWRLPSSACLQSINQNTFVKRHKSRANRRRVKKKAGPSGYRMSCRFLALPVQIPVLVRVMLKSGCSFLFYQIPGCVANPLVLGIFAEPEHFLGNFGMISLKTSHSPLLSARAEKRFWIATWYWYCTSGSSNLDMLYRLFSWLVAAASSASSSRWQSLVYGLCWIPDFCRHGSS